MVGLLHPHETCCFLRPVVVIFCWYLVSEKKSTNNVRDATNTMVYSEISYLLTGLPGFLHPQCYKNSQYPIQKHQKTSVNIVETTQKIQVESQLMSPNSSNEPAGVQTMVLPVSVVYNRVPTLTLPRFPSPAPWEGIGQFLFFCGNSSPTWNTGICISRKVVTNLQPWSSCSDRYAGSISLGEQFNSHHPSTPRFSSAPTGRNKTTSKYMMLSFRSLHRPEWGK